MRVVRHHEHAIAGNCHASIRAARYGAADSLGPAALIMPDRPAGACVQRPALIGAGDIHHALHHYGSDLQVRAIGNWKYPMRGKPGNVRRIDAGEFAKAISARVAIVARPVGGGNYRTVTVAYLAQ